MRTLALSAVVLALGLTSAQASLTPLVDWSVGTLTCTPRTDVGIVVGAATAADCTFVSDRDGAAQNYVALLPASASAQPARLTWRVVTRRGADRPGMLSGVFADQATWRIAPRPSAPAGLIGPAASLRPTGSDADVRSLARIELAAVPASPAN